LNKFEPKIKTIPDIVKKIITLKNSLWEIANYIEI
jgi:hypothetical protein